MPYFKPEEAYRLQQIAMTAHNVIADNYYDSDAVGSAMRRCPICGDMDCSKDIVEVNNVWIHPEDIDEDRVRENPRLQEY